MQSQPDDSGASNNCHFHFNLSQVAQGHYGSHAANNRIQDSVAHVGNILETLPARTQSETDLPTLQGSASADATLPVEADRPNLSKSDSDTKLFQGSHHLSLTTSRLLTTESELVEEIAEDELESLTMAFPGSTFLSDDDKFDSQKTIQILGKKPKYIQISSRGLFYQGRLIYVSDESSEESIRGCAMLVLTVSDEGFSQCLMLCQHEGVDGDDEERAFWETHSALYSQSTIDRNSNYKNKPNEPITVQITDPSEVCLADKCFVNYQHTWTLRKEIVKAAPIGKLSVDEVKKMLGNYKRVQNAMYLDPKH